MPSWTTGDRTQARATRIQLARVARSEAAGLYGRRGFVSFQHDVLHTPNTRPPLLDRLFNELGGRF
jgi:hypothetical protein